MTRPLEIATALTVAAWLAWATGTVSNIAAVLG